MAKIGILIEDIPEDPELGFEKYFIKRMVKMARIKRNSSVPAEKLHEVIARQAHELYERSGYQVGRDLDNWLEAEKIVKAQLFNKS